MGMRLGRDTGMETNKRKVFFFGLVGLQVGAYRPRYSCMHGVGFPLEQLELAVCVPLSFKETEGEKQTDRERERERERILERRVRNNDADRERERSIHRSRAAAALHAYSHA